MKNLSFFIQPNGLNKDPSPKKDKKNSFAFYTFYMIFCFCFCFCISFFFSQAALAVGLGDLKIKSYLNEKLNAELKLVGEWQDKNNIQLTFDVSGAEDSYEILYKINLAQKTAKIYTAKPFAEDVINLEVTISENDNKVSKKYKKVLDINPKILKQSAEQGIIEVQEAESAKEDIAFKNQPSVSDIPSKNNSENLAHSNPDFYVAVSRSTKSQSQSQSQNQKNSEVEKNISMPIKSLKNKSEPSRISTEKPEQKSEQKSDEKFKEKVEKAEKAENKKESTKEEETSKASPENKTENKAESKTESTIKQPLAISKPAQETPADKPEIKVQVQTNPKMMTDYLNIQSSVNFSGLKLPDSQYHQKNAEALYQKDQENLLKLHMQRQNLLKQLNALDAKNTSTATATATTTSPPPFNTPTMATAPISTALGTISNPNLASGVDANSNINPTQNQASRVDSMPANIGNSLENMNPENTSSDKFSIQQSLVISNPAAPLGFWQQKGQAMDQFWAKFDQQAQKKLILAILAILGFILLAVSIYYGLRYRARKKRQAIKKRLDLMVKELNELKALSELNQNWLAQFSQKK